MSNINNELKQVSGGILPFEEIHVGDYCGVASRGREINYIYEVTAIIDENHVEVTEHKMKSFDVKQSLVPFVDEHIRTPGIIMNIHELWIMKEVPSWVFRF